MSSLPPPTSADLRPSTTAATANAPQQATDHPINPPSRLPRPLTAADICWQLEQEQEAVVNRLTRELSFLRAEQNASPISTVSTTSTAIQANDAAGRSATDKSNANPHRTSSSGFTIPPLPGRHPHRSTSNASSRAFTAHTGPLRVSSSIPNPPRPANSGSGPLNLSAVSHSTPTPSTTTSNRSVAGSPSPRLPIHPPLPQQAESPGTGGSGYFPHHTPPTLPLSNTPSTPAGVGEFSPGIMPATARLEETAFYRSELEAAKRENEGLKRHIIELERMVRQRRESDASLVSHGAPPSECLSTKVSVASLGRALGTTSAASDFDSPSALSVAIGVPEDEVRVGESAASAALASRDKEL